MMWSNVKYHVYSTWLKICINQTNSYSKVKLGIKELLNKKQTGFKELFTDYQLFYTINILSNMEPLPIQEMPKLGISEHKIVKISKKRDFRNFLDQLRNTGLIGSRSFQNYSRVQKSIEKWSVCSKMALGEVGVSRP